MNLIQALAFASGTLLAFGNAVPASDVLVPKAGSSVRVLYDPGLKIAKTFEDVAVTARYQIVATAPALSTVTIIDPATGYEAADV